MTVLTNSSTITLWQEAIQFAENRCQVTLQPDLETYLIALLMRYSNQPEVAKRVLATAFLEAAAQQRLQRQVSLQHVGDECLLLAGLFPKIVERKQVKISYFVNLGQTAYSAISQKANDLYGLLALQFVVLMDVLQSIHQNADLMPLEAYDQWREVGSQRALAILKTYTKGFPIDPR
ncbi:MAG TPA: hypothetical protein VHZ76_08445 [Gammaproteobacteria bacterium]|nr:hypothetical protein [Gammaproteobacteria bacterium]